jgi:uncharacterized protein YjiS (DUF1127 family)
MSLKSTTFTASFPLPTRTRPAFLSAALKALSIWRERQQLKELDAHLLDDLGLSRLDVELETKRPVWDAPNRWTR